MAEEIGAKRGQSVIPRALRWLWAGGWCWGGVGGGGRGSRGVSRTLSQIHINTVSGPFSPGKKIFVLGLWGRLQSSLASAGTRLRCGLESAP